jgi:hypothetical protein
MDPQSELFARTSRFELSTIYDENILAGTAASENSKAVMAKDSE